MEDISYESDLEGNEPVIDFPEPARPAPDMSRDSIVQLMDQWLIKATDPNCSESLARVYLGGVRFGRDLMEKMSYEMEYGKYTEEKARAGAQQAFQMRRDRDRSRGRNKPRRFDRDSVS